MLDPTTPIEGVSDADGNPLTRGALVELITVDLTAIRDRVGEAVAGFEAGTITPDDLVNGVHALVKHLIGYTNVTTKTLLEHDVRQMYLDQQVGFVVIPDDLGDLT